MLIKTKINFTVLEQEMDNISEALFLKSGARRFISEAIFIKEHRKFINFLRKYIFKPKFVCFLAIKQ